MGLSYTRHRHPAFAVGYVTVFVCLVFLAILTITGIVPLALQPPLIMSVLITVIIGGSFGLFGFFKSYDRQAYPLIFIVVIVVPVVFVIIWHFSR